MTNPPNVAQDDRVDVFKKGQYLPIYIPHLGTPFHASKEQGNQPQTPGLTLQHTTASQKHGMVRH